MPFSLRRFTFCVFFLTISVPAWANFDFNANCVSAYKNILQLNFAQARTLISNEKKLHPDNAVTAFLENSLDYYSVILSSRKQDFDAWKKRRDERIDRIDDEDENSPYYRYMQAHIHLQWAFLYGQFGEFSSAGFAINKAYSLLQANQKKYPSFLPDDIDLAMVNVLLGSLPDGALKSSLQFFGIKGNTQAGLNILQKLTVSLPKSGYAFFYDELVFYLSHVQCDIVQDKNAYEKALKYAQIMPDSAYKSYILGYSAIRTGHSKEALRWLSNPVFNNRFPVFNYYRGVAELNQLNFNAKTSFTSFLKQNTGNFYVKDAYLRLGWIADLSGNDALEKSLFSLAKQKGDSYHDKDKQVLSELSDGAFNPALLKARLLFDGGLYEKAEEILKAVSPDKLNAKDRLEYYYRQGRVYDELDSPVKALANFSQAIQLGKNLKYYFAANSALQSGLIYAREGDKVRAKSFLELAIAMKNHQFETSIERKAKQALKAL